MHTDVVCLRKIDLVAFIEDDFLAGFINRAVAFNVDDLYDEFHGLTPIGLSLDKARFLIKIRMPYNRASIIINCIRL